MPELEIDISGLGPPENAPKNGAAKREAGARRPPPKRRRGIIPPTPVAIGAMPTTPSPPLEDQDRDAVAAWPRIMKEQAEQGFTPEMIGARLFRQAIGPQKSPEVALSPFGCELVAGSEGVSPGEDLYNYIVDYYHMGTPGPALYKITFFHKNGGQKLPGSACELRLD